MSSYLTKLGSRVASLNFSSSLRIYHGSASASSSCRRSHSPSSSTYFGSLSFDFPSWLLHFASTTHWWNPAAWNSSFEVLLLCFAYSSSTTPRYLLLLNSNARNWFWELDVPLQAFYSWRPAASWLSSFVAFASWAWYCSSSRHRAYQSSSPVPVSAVSPCAHTSLTLAILLWISLRTSRGQLLSGDCRNSKRSFISSFAPAEFDRMQSMPWAAGPSPFERWLAPPADSFCHAVVPAAASALSSPPVDSWARWLSPIEIDSWAESTYSAFSWRPWRSPASVSEPTGFGSSCCS